MNGRLLGLVLLGTIFCCFPAHADDDVSVALRQSIANSSAVVRSEILRSVMVNKAVQEGVAAFRQKTRLQSDAAELSREMKQPELLCQTMASQDAMTSRANVARSGAASSQRAVLREGRSNTNTLASVESAFRASSQKFCSDDEVGQGICKATADPLYANLAGADQDAMFLFQSRSGSNTYEGQRDGSQAQAVNAYIKRVVVGSAPPERLRVAQTAYQTNPQVRAHVELQRRYDAFLSMATYSLNRIQESRQPAAK